VGHYTKLALVGLRTIAVIMFVYGAPMLVYAVLTQRSGGAAEQATRRSSLLGWAIYLVVGTALYALSRPLARVVASDLDSALVDPPLSNDR